jgi:hypothetical protein
VSRGNLINRWLGPRIGCSFRVGRFPPGLPGLCFLAPRERRIPLRSALRNDKGGGGFQLMWGYFRTKKACFTGGSDRQWSLRTCHSEWASAHEESPGRTTSQVFRGLWSQVAVLMQASGRISLATGVPPRMWDSTISSTSPAVTWPYQTASG